GYWIWFFGHCCNRGGSLSPRRSARGLPHRNCRPALPTGRRHRSARAILAPSIVGLLCLIGIVYLVIRVINVHILMLGWALIGVYLWIVASMVLPLVGTTLRGCRLELLVVLIMTTAAVLGLAHLYEQYRTREYLAAVVAVITALAGIFYM